MQPLLGTTFAAIVTLKTLVRIVISKVDVVVFVLSIRDDDDDDDDDDGEEGIDQRCTWTRRASHYCCLAKIHLLPGINLPYPQPRDQHPYIIFAHSYFAS